MDVMGWQTGQFLGWYQMAFDAICEEISPDSKIRADLLIKTITKFAIGKY